MEFFNQELIKWMMANFSGTANIYNVLTDNFVEMVVDALIMYKFRDDLARSRSGNDFLLLLLL